MKHLSFLPATAEDLRATGWECVDIVLVTGDAYVDLPSFGVSLIGRWLEHHGFRIAILAQPRHDRPTDFTRFGRPRLFFGITAGNLDSIVANYSGNGKVRDVDQYSPGGNPYFDENRNKANRRRPDRATILYTNLAKAAYPDVPVILGGLEASLRRFVHYDYKQEKLRASVLSDAKADLIVYGMGERAILEIAGRLQNKKNLQDIAGACERLTEKEMTAREFSLTPKILPPWDEINQDTKNFMTAERFIDAHARTISQTPILQRQQVMWVLQNRPAEPLTTPELDLLYSLPFSHASHPSYCQPIPAYTMIRHSVTIVRGCYGNCSFCAITRHQGPIVTSRSVDSVVAEVKQLSRRPDFNGTVSDLGGPTANMFATSCKQPICHRHDCLYPRLCPDLSLNENTFLALLDQVTAIMGVRHVYISSGLRMELLINTPELLSRLLARHTPGALKIAPEHTQPNVLRLMHKHHPQILDLFLLACRNIVAKLGFPLQFTPYFIASHPGCTKNDMEQLAKSAKNLGLPIRQFQDFTPTPGTLSTAMFVSNLDRDNLQPLKVPRTKQERKEQRLVLEKLLPKK